MEPSEKNKFNDMQSNQIAVDYVSTLVDIYMFSNKAFYEACEIYQLLPEELLYILDNPNLVDISFLDELVALGFNSLNRDKKQKYDILK